MTSTLQTVKALDKRSQSVESGSQSGLKWLKQNFELILSMGDDLLEEQKKITNKKEINRFVKGCGGKKFVEPYTQITTWYRSLIKEWQDKIIDLPFWNLEKEQWNKLAKLTVEQLEEWYEEIIQLSEDFNPKSVTNLLSPKIFDQTIAQFLPKAPKKTIPLGEILDDEYYEVVRNIVEYGFTDDSFEELKQEVIERAEDDPVTEDLFEPLEKRGLDPFLILSRNSQLALENQKLALENQKILVEHEKDIVKLQEKDLEIVTLKEQVKAFDQQIDQIKEHFTQQLQQQEAQYKNQIDQHQKEIAQHQNKIAQLEEQMTAIMKHLPSLQQVTA